MAKRPHWYCWLIRSTKRVQPYCRLAITTIQTMPTISCMIRYRMAAGAACPSVAAVSMCIPPGVATDVSRSHQAGIPSSCGRVLVQCRGTNTTDTTRPAQRVPARAPGPAIREQHLTHQTAVAVCRVHDNRHVTLQDQVTREPPRVRAEGLRLLRSDTAIQPHRDRLPLTQYADDIAIAHTHDLARALLGRGTTRRQPAPQHH